MTRRAAARAARAAAAVPLGANFRPRDPGSPTADIPRLVAAAAGKPVVLQEVGYPSAALLGSSERAQAEFVARVFGAWRAQGGGRIPFLNCSLGLRQANGTPKAAWRTFADSGKALR